MMNRKIMKKAAKRSLKKHYWIFLAACLIAAFLNVEFSGTLSFAQVNVKPAQEAEGSPSSGNTALQQAGAWDVMNDILSGNEKEGKQLSEQIRQAQIQQSGQANPAFGRSRGVLAQAVNSITSGSLFVTIASAVNGMVKSKEVALLILIGLSMTLMLGFWFFVTNVYMVISRRIFLEGRNFEIVPIQRFLFLFRVRKWTKAAWTMLVKYIYEFLWSLTVIGGIIKRYSYYMVPYIVAENPDISAKNAIRLSRKMMNGHKWECFVFELSFLGWSMLGAVTMGLSQVLYSNPYRVASFTEYYVALRKMAKERNIPEAQQLNDIYLYRPAGREALDLAYADVIAVMKKPKKEIDDLKGIRKFFADYLGILLFPSAKEREYEKDQAERTRIFALQRAVEGKCYPSRLDPIPEMAKRQKVETVHYMRHYTVWSLILLFFIFSCIGWVWEVSLHLVNDGEFVNRGVLHGPWLPIYGSGGVLILTVLNKFRKNPAAEFVAIVVLCGVVEYFTSYYLEVTQGKKWWDYSGYFLNLNGRICAEGLLVFGVGGMAIVYALAPVLDNFIRRQKLKVVIPACLVLLGVYIGDAAYSSEHPNAGKGITDYQSRDVRLDMYANK